MGDNGSVAEQEYEVSQSGVSRSSDQPCTTTAYQYADLCIPVMVNPSAAVGEIRTECCGKPVINCRENSMRRNCEITIEQKIRIRIPIRYTAAAKVGEVSIACSGECGCDSACGRGSDCGSNAEY